MNQSLIVGISDERLHLCAWAVVTSLLINVLHSPCAGHSVFSCCSLPVSFATIFAICARSLLSSSCRAVVRFRAVTPGFFSPSILLPSRRKLGTDEFLCSTSRGVGRHSCFRGRASLLQKQELFLSNAAVGIVYTGENFHHALGSSHCVKYHIDSCNNNLVFFFFVYFYCHHLTGSSNFRTAAPALPVSIPPSSLLSPFFPSLSLQRQTAEHWTWICWRFHSVKGKYFPPHLCQTACSACDLILLPFFVKLILLYFTTEDFSIKGV